MTFCAGLLAFIVANLVWPQADTAAISAITLWLLYCWPVARSFRAADLVTACRLGLALATFVAYRSGNIPATTCALVLLLPLALDGVDGWLARRYGVTDFGALFDMESDNALLAVIWLSAASVPAPQPAKTVLVVGMVIPLYRVGLVALEALRRGTEPPPSRPVRQLMGLPLTKVLFVAVAGLSLLSLAAVSYVPTWAAAAAALATGCSTFSFWPDFRQALR